MDSALGRRDERRRPSVVVVVVSVVVVVAVKEMIDQSHGIVSSTAGRSFVES